MNEAKSVPLDKIQLGQYEIIVSINKEDREDNPYRVKLHSVDKELSMEDMFVIDRYLVTEGFKETWDQIVLNLNKGDAGVEIPEYLSDDSLAGLISILKDKLNQLLFLLLMAQLQESNYNPILFFCFF